MNKKAQIKIQETAFVLLAIVLLFGIIAMFYFKFQSLNVIKKAEAAKEDRALSMLDKIAAMPELACSSSIGARTSAACIDRDKLQIFNSMKDYEKMWAGLKEVKVRQIYPEAGEGTSNDFILYDSGAEEKQSYSTFISICEQDKTDYKCTLGMISISI